MARSSTRSTRSQRRQPEQGQSGKSWLILFVSGVVLFGVAVFVLLRGGSQPSQASPAAVGSQASGPRLEVDQTEQDLGSFKFNTPAHSEFTLRDTGDQPVQIVGTPQVTLVQGC